MQSHKVTFKNASGDALAGLIDMPAEAPRAYALFAHCFTCSKNLRAAHHIARELTDAGLAVLRFDFTGIGHSEGDFANTDFSSNVADLIAACRYLAAAGRAPSLLVGHSLGGTAILQAAGDVPSAVAVATIGSPADPGHVANMFGDVRKELEETGTAEVRLGGRSFRIRRQFLDDLERHNLPEAIARLRKALLIMHAPLDDTVEIANAAELFAAAKHPKSFISLDNADHLLSRRADSRYAGRVLAAWASRYLPAPAERDTLEADRQHVVARTYADGFRTGVAAGSHQLVADEPADVGGTDLGPTPYDLLSAALATCTSMTLRMYAHHKNLALRSVTVDVAHDKVHAEDCADCETKAGKIDEFRREISFDGDLNDAQKRRLLEIADRCPVHRTLEAEIRIRTALAPD